MSHISRYLQLADIVNKKSVFLFGPRQTGKSTIIRHQFQDLPTYNLLDANTYRELNNDPSTIRRQLLADSRPPSVVVIDEIQLLPELLNEVHLMIEEHGVNFLLTGSSARALRRKGVNLLAGRARQRFLHPFTSQELGDKFDLIRALNRGLIPSIYFSDEFQEDLVNYCGVYLKEEISAEGLTRNVPAFSRFLEVAAKCNGGLLNYTNVASDAEVKRSTVVSYFEILRDTLIAYDLPAWKRTTKRKPITSSKFYFFDIGLVNSLSKVGEIRPGSASFGHAFEHFIFHELRSYVDYHNQQELHYWRSKSGFEVDFILNNEIAIEVKAKATISSKDTKGLRALREEEKISQFCVVSTCQRRHKIDGITIYPYREFLQKLWSRNF